MITYRILLKIFSKQGYSLLTMKETDDYFVFISEENNIFTYFSEKQTRLLESVLREIREKVSKAPSDIHENVKIEIWIPPSLFFFSKYERLFLKKLTVLCCSLATNSKGVISIKSYKWSVKAFLNYRKMKKTLRHDQWYQLKKSIPDIDITEY